MGPEQNMHMIYIMVPLLKGDMVARSNILENFFQPTGYFIIKDFVPVFDAHDKVILQQEY